MKSIEGRIETLEKKVNPSGGEGKLYDFDGNEITDAKVLRWPTENRRGLAIMPDGTKKEIDATCKVMLIDILRERCRRSEAGEVRQRMSDEESARWSAVRRGLLFLRQPGEGPPFINQLLK